MTDESKPKVEPWMREACERRQRWDNGLETPTHAEEVEVMPVVCICPIIASAFARSRPAVAAGEIRRELASLQSKIDNHQAYDKNAGQNIKNILAILAAPPSSDPVPAPRETAGAVASDVICAVCYDRIWDCCGPALRAAAKGSA